MKSELGSMRVTNVHPRQKTKAKTKKNIIAKTEGCPKRPQGLHKHTGLNATCTCTCALAAGPQLLCAHSDVQIISSAHMHAPLSCETSGPSHKVKNKIINNFKMATREH